MKTKVVIISSLILLFSVSCTLAQNVGIGTHLPVQKLDVDGAIKVGSSDTGEPGTIRWTGTHFEGFNGSDWIRLDLRPEEVPGGEGGQNGWVEDADTIHLENIIDRVGIGTESPEAKLEVHGTFALAIDEVVLPNGTSDNVIIPDQSVIAISGPSSTYKVTGFTGGIDGRIIYLHNNSPSKMAILHMDPGSLPENQIKCPGDTKTDIKKSGTATLIYHGAQQKWLLMNGN